MPGVSTYDAVQICGDTSPETVRDFYELVTPQDVNEWAARGVVPWRWEVEPPATEAGTPDGAPVGAEIDYSMLTTRQKLIDVFGIFTGMKASWFHNLKDTPALLAARKVVGQGGKGHIAEPLFCPYDVMCWLVDAKRKKGQPLSESKAWELLEKHFRNVYNAHSIGDPRDSD